MPGAPISTMDSRATSPPEDDERSLRDLTGDERARVLRGGT